MKILKLMKLVLTNFQGIRSFTVESSGDCISIYGENGTGKTTVSNAFRWLLFDKNSNDKSDFTIKTQDENGNPLHGLDHTVEGVFSIDGKIRTFKKIFHEKWEKKRGCPNTQFTGHETLYFVNEIPKTLKEYKEAVSDMMDEGIFKLITDPIYFGSTIKWQDRRMILMQMNGGELSHDAVINYNPALEALRKLLDNSTLEEIRKRNASTKKKLNEELMLIPSRIDEANRSIKDLNFYDLKNKLKAAEGSLEEIEKSLMGFTQSDSLTLKKRTEANLLRTRITNIERQIERQEFERKNKVSQSLTKQQYELNDLEKTLSGIAPRRNRINDEIATLEEEIQAQRVEWQKIHNEQLEFTDEAAFHCPACRQILPTQDIENKKQQMLDNFNADKAKRLNSINAQGKAKADKVKSLKAELQELDEKESSTNQKIDTCKEQILSLEAEKSQQDTAPIYPAEYYSLEESLSQLEAEIETPQDATEEINSLKEEKKRLQNEIDSIKSDLRFEETNKVQKERIKELELRERTVAQEIADLEQMDYLCDTYIKTQVELLEAKINSRFSMVNFRLFKTQINGGVEECCDVLVNSNGSFVPFQDANTAGRINAGIDIINALSDFYQISAPIVIDNRESVIRLIDTNAQIINLIVHPDFPQLKVA